MALCKINNMIIGIKKTLMSFIALFFSLGCMAYSEEQTKMLVYEFYDKLNILANEVYSHKDEIVTEFELETRRNIEEMVWSRYVNMPNDFQYYGIGGSYSFLEARTYPLHLKDVVMKLHRHNLPYSPPYQINILSVDSSIINNISKEVFYKVKQNKIITFEEKSVSFDEEIIILTPSYEIVKNSNKATDPDMVLIDVDENEEEEEEQQAKTHQLVYLIQNIERRVC